MQHAEHISTKFISRARSPSNEQLLGDRGGKHPGGKQGNYAHLHCRGKILCPNKNIDVPFGFCGPKQKTLSKKNPRTFVYQTDETEKNT